MGLASRSKRHSLSRKSGTESVPMTNDDSNTGANASSVNGQTSSNAENHKTESSLASPKRQSRFRLSSVRQIGTATRNEIRSKVRNDWEWPPPTNAESVSLDLGSRIQPDTPFVEREPGSEESMDDDDSEDDEDDENDDNEEALDKADETHHTAENLNKNGYSGNEADEPVPSEANSQPDTAQPSSVAGQNRGGSNEYGLSNQGTGIRPRSATMQQEKQQRPAKSPAEARKERRRRQLREELCFNKGLQVFEARRNAWTGAEFRYPDGTPVHSRSFKAADRTSRSGDQAESTQENIDSPTNGSDESEDSTTHSSSVTNDTLASSHESLTDQITAPRQLSEHPGAVSGLEHEDLVPYIPKAPSLIPADHPVRREINASTYQQIYSRVVVQGTTPNVPVNLADMISVLVAGWKADDQWPPKPGPLDPLVGRRRGKAANIGPEGAEEALGANGKHHHGLVSGIKRVLRITSHGADKSDPAARLPSKATALLE